MGPTVRGGLAMSCDRESVTSCQDLLAMSRTRRYSYWVHQRFGLVCQLFAAGLARVKVESGGNRLRRRPSLTRGRMHSHQESGRDEKLWRNT